MKHLRGAKLTLVVAASAVVLGFTASPGFAGYDFQFTTQDYAQEVAMGGLPSFVTIVQNTGTVGDSIRFVLSKNLPPGWGGFFCVQGMCFFEKGSIYSAPGQLDTMTVDVYTDSTTQMGLMTLTGTMRNAPTVTHSETYAAFTELPSIMIVDDDAGMGYQTYLVNALQAAGYPTRVWDADLLGRPGAIQLKSYWGVFWTTAGGDATYLTSADENDMAAFLDANGRLFLASMGFLSSRTGPSEFTTNYLHIASWTSNTGGSPMSGVAGDPISNGMSLGLLGGPFPPDSSDSMVLGSGAEPFFSYSSSVTGLRASESGHKVVFVSFPFEDVSTSDPAPDNQNTLIFRVMQWFDPPVAGIDVGPASRGRALVLRQNWPNPFRAQTTISFLVPGGSRDAQVAIYSVNGQVVKTLVGGDVGSSETSVVWDGKDTRGASVAPGVYFCKLSAAGSSVLKKMVVVK